MQRILDINVLSLAIEGGHAGIIAPGRFMARGVLLKFPIASKRVYVEAIEVQLKGNNQFANQVAAEEFA